MDIVEEIILTLVLIFCVYEIKCGVVYAKTIREEMEIINCTRNNESVSSLAFESRKKEEDLMSKILPMMVMPFMTQTALLPMMLMSMKFTLIQSMFLGKLAIIFGFITYLRNYLKNPGGLFSHNINVRPSHHHELSSQNYGYTRMKEKNFVTKTYRYKIKKKRKKRETSVLGYDLLKSNYYLPMTIK